MQVFFYNKSIINFIESLEDNYKSDIAKAIGLLELFGYKIEFPHSRSLSKGLFELRCLSTAARLFYCFADNKAVILHVIIKKRNKITPRDLALARKRQKQLAKI